MDIADKIKFLEQIYWILVKINLLRKSMLQDQL